MRRTIVLLLLMVCGCGPSPQQVADKYQPQMDKLRQQLLALVPKLPRAVGDQQASSPLNPPLVLIEDDPSSNAEVIAFEYLSNPAAKLDFDLLINNDMNSCLRWTSDLPPSSSGDATFMQKCFERTLAKRYLVVHRVLDYQPPQALSEDRYAPGKVRVAGIVVDLQNDAVLATYIVQSQSAPKVDFVTRGDESRGEGLERFARSSLWEATRKAAAEKLARMTGGTVQFDKNSPRHIGEPIPGSTAPAVQPPVVSPPVIAPPVVSNTPPVPSTSPAIEPPAVVASETPPAIPKLEATQQYLRDLKPIETAVLTQNEHQLIRDFTVRGIKFTHGLYTHPPAANQSARVVFALDKKYQTLAGGVGQSDGFPPTSFTALTFRIVGDGRELFKSSPIKQHGEWMSFSVDVSGVERLELIAECPGDHSFAWGAWMDPVLTQMK